MSGTISAWKANHVSLTGIKLAVDNGTLGGYITPGDMIPAAAGQLLGGTNVPGGAVGIQLGANLTLANGILSAAGGGSSGLPSSAIPAASGALLGGSGTQGQAQAIQLGTNLTLSGNTLNATGGSSGTSYTFSTGLTNTSGTVTVNFGTTSGTAAAGNDSRITGAIQPSGTLTAGHQLVVASDGKSAADGGVPQTFASPGTLTARSPIQDTDLGIIYDTNGNDYNFVPPTLVSYVLSKVEPPVAVAYSATPTLNCQNGFARNFEIAALTGNIAIPNPTNLSNGQTVSIRLVQDSTGGRTATWGSMFKFQGGAKTLSTTAGAVDKFVGIYSSATGFIEGSLALGIG